MNGVEVRATVSEKDGHLWDTEGEGAGTVAAGRVQNPLGEGKSKSCGGPATWCPRGGGRERITFKWTSLKFDLLYLSLSLIHTCISDLTDCTEERGETAVII